MIELNADIGEGSPHDAILLNYVRRANIACGLHAGSAQLTAATLRLAAEAGVKLGAHPGYDDRANFGRLPMDLPDLGAAVLNYQVGALAALADMGNAKLDHLKLHGAFYHAANTDEDIAELVLNVARRFDLAVVSMPDTAMHRVCEDAGWPFIREGFADRRYAADGTLVPRHLPQAMLTDPAEVMAQAARLHAAGIQSLCLHGDGPHAPELARMLAAMP